MNQNNSYGGGATVLTSTLSTNKWTYTGKVSTGGGNTALNIFSPNLAAKTSFSNIGSCLSSIEISNWWSGGALNTTTQYTDITITTSSSTTSFTYKIYGYSNS